jgi:dTDP-4-amino-4,6-dideoxygalactose transaminase
MTNPAEMSITRATVLRDALATMDRAGTGLLLLLREDGTFERTVTDGDLRRLLLDGRALHETLDTLAPLRSIVIKAPFSRREALELLNRHAINHLPVLDERERVLEVLERREIDEQILLSTPHMGEAERDFVEEAFQTNWIAPLGPNVDAFEREIAQLVGIKHAAALSSGTAAIHLALRLLGVGRDDRVFCSSLTFAASANPIVYQGALPVFIDSEPESWNMSPRALERALAAAQRENALPKAVVIVNLYGQSADMDPLLELCRHYGVEVVEDAAESLGARYKGKASGSFGRIGVFSFNGNKIITTSGGGMLIADEEALVQKARFLATQARDPAPHYQHSEIGYNYRMSNILAGIGRGQLRVLDERVKARRAVFDFYRQALGDIDVLCWMPEPKWSFATHWLSTATVRPSRGLDAGELIRRLAAELIEARPLWKPMHLQPVFAHCPFFAHGAEPVADQLFADGICLPSGSNMTTAQLERVADAIRKVVRPRKLAAAASN